MNSVMPVHQNHSDRHGFPLRRFAAAFAISICVAVLTGWQLWQAHNRVDEISKKHIALAKAIGRIMLLDEVLTMSARMAAATGDFSYEKRYDQFDPQLTTEINAVRAMLPQQEIEIFVGETDEANLALVKMERQAFALTHQGKRQEATALLAGDEYTRLKKIYAGGMEKTGNAVNDLIAEDARRLHSLFLELAVVSAVSVLVLLATWFFAARAARHWAAERMEAEDTLQKAADELEVRVEQRTADLTCTNEQLLHEISERKQAEEKIRQLAFYDTLTQLPNRHLLNDRMEQTMAASKRSGRYGALMFLDLDNFKPLNDMHGHDVGDLLLIEVAHRITRCVRETDTVARFGGDEFVVMLSELDEDKSESTAQAGIVAEKIRTTLAEPYVLTIQQEGKADTITLEHHCTSSIGVMLFINHEASREDILKWADMAMYQAKEAGRNLIRFYDSIA